MTAREELRAFEDRVLGADAPRYAGEVERGHGSKFQAMSHEEHAEHAALEKLVAAEQNLEKATTELARAQERHAEATAAHARVAIPPAEEPVEEPADGLQ